jgi:arabinofuranosyltransferase
MRFPQSATRALRSSQFWLCALIVAAALAARLIPGPRTIDDAFITFRYARNLLAGNGFVYNPGQAVLGTTTPLYTLLMAGLGAPWAASGPGGAANAPFPELALAVNALADAATCLLLVWLGRRMGARWAGWAAAAMWAVAPFSVTFAIGGLETSLYVLLLTGTAAAALAEKRVTAALLAALSLLTRPDALILLGPLALERLYAAFIARPRQEQRDIRTRSRQKLRWSEAAAFGIPVLAWGIFAALTFGSPLPNSILAKAVAYHLQPLDALVRLIQHYATPFLEQDLLGAPLAVAIGIVLYPALSIIGSLAAFKNAPRLLPWLLYPWLYLVTFALPNPLIFRWYLTPPLPAYFLLILFGLERLLSLLTRTPTAAKSRRGYAVLAILLIYPLLFTLSDWRLHPDHGPDRPAPEMAYIQLELLYRQAAGVIAPQMDSHSLLAAGDVGVLGYYTPARILDTVGLNSPESSRYYPLPAGQYVINYAIPAQLILDQRPDFVVILEVYGRETLLKDASFLAEYRLLQKIDTDMYGSDGMLIFQRIK